MMLEPPTRAYGFTCTWGTTSPRVTPAANTARPSRENQATLKIILRSSFDWRFLNFLVFFPSTSDGLFLSECTGPCSSFFLFGVRRARLSSCYIDLQSSSFLSFFFLSCFMVQLYYVSV